MDKNLPGSGVLILYADDTVAECLHGEAPVKIVDADPSVPYLEGAAFDIGEGNRDTFTDRAQRKNQASGEDEPFLRNPHHRGTGVSGVVAIGSDGLQSLDPER